MADDFANALAREYARMHSAGDLRNRLAGDPSIPPPTPYQDALASAGSLHRHILDADPVEMAMGLLGPNARVPGAASLVRRLAELPKPPMRDALASDFSLRESAPSRSGNVYWDVEPPASLGRPNLPMGGIQARVDPAAKAVHIEGSNLLGDLRGRGIGTEMYQRLMDEAHKLGYKVHSDNNVSADAQKIYEALAQRGYRVERNPDATLNRAGELWVKDSYAPVFTVHPPEYASPEMAEIIKR